MRKSVSILSLLFLLIFLDTVALSVSVKDALSSSTDNHISYLPIAYYDYDIETGSLMRLYYSTDGPNWLDNSGWGVGDPCTQNWYGVLCEDHHILVLSLAGNALSGVVPGALGNLSHLEYLQLDGNISLLGPIPAELGGLTNLRELILHWNSLEGPMPPELSRMSNLEMLDLSLNLLSGSIPRDLGKMIELKWLDLGFNQLSGSIPPELGDLKNLQSLILSNNQLSGTIPSELSKLSNLDYLSLSNNPGLTCWETEEALDWALSITYCRYYLASDICVPQPGYSGPEEVCQP